MLQPLILRHLLCSVHNNLQEEGVGELDDRLAGELRECRVWRLDMALSSLTL